jgi:hypothetical protein
MGIKDWRKQRKLNKLKGVAALDHGILRGKGIEKKQKWENKGGIKY